MTNDPLLTTGEAAELLKVPAGTLTQWRYRRTGPPWIKLGRQHVRYRVSDVLDWLAANTRQPASR